MGPFFMKQGFRCNNSYRSAILINLPVRFAQELHTQVIHIVLITLWITVNVEFSYSFLTDYRGFN